MKHASLETLASFSMGPITMRPFAGDKLMIVLAELPGGSVAPRHSHPHEQLTIVFSGRVEGLAFPRLEDESRRRIEAIVFEYLDRQGADD